MKELKLSPDLSLPLDAATQTFAWIGRKGQGKTYGAGKLVELLVDAGIQCVILDTVGNWYGLRLAADGKGPGLDIPVLGGLRGDVPLEAAGGALIADLVVDTGRSIILDVSQFNKADRQRFAFQFAEQLWQRKKGERDPSPVHVVLEECQLIIPENVRGDTARMVGAWEEIVRLGRNYGVGVSMLTQRPQSVNKEVLNQAEPLCVFQLIGSHERDAVKKWVVQQDVDVNLLHELPSLPRGTCWFWSPAWLGTLEKVAIGKKATFDASATPKVGERRVARDLKPLDLDAIKARMAEVIERNKANDPRELRAEVARLKREVEAAKAAKPAAPAKEKRVEVPVVKDAQIARLERLVERMFDIAGSKTAMFEEWAKRLAEFRAGISSDAHMLRAAIAAAKGGPPATPPTLSTLTTGGAARKPLAGFAKGTFAPREDFGAPMKLVDDADAEASDDNGSPGGGAVRRILAVLAQHHPQSVQPRKLAILAQLKRGGSTWRGALATARKNAWVQDEPGGGLRITQVGVGALGRYEPLPTGRELLAHYYRRFGDSATGRILRGVASTYPEAAQGAHVADIAGVEFRGSTWRGALAKLRGLELIDKRDLKLSDELAQ